MGLISPSEAELRKPRVIQGPGSERPEEQSLPETAAALPSVVTGKDRADGLLTESERKARDRASILAALDASKGKIFGPGGAAEILDVKPTTLISRIRSLGIEVRRRR